MDAAKNTDPLYQMPSTGSLAEGVYFSKAYTSSPTSSETTSRFMTWLSVDASVTVERRLREDSLASRREGVKGWMAYP